MHNEDRILICGMRRQASGTAFLAEFDARIGGINLAGCRLVQRADGHIVAFPPGERDAAGIRPVWFADKDLKARFERLAILKFRETGGVLGDLGRALCAGALESLDAAGV